MLNHEDPEIAGEIEEEEGEEEEGTDESEAKLDPIFPKLVGQMTSVYVVKGRERVMELPAEVSLDEVESIVHDELPPGRYTIRPRKGVYFLGGHISIDTSGSKDPPKLDPPKNVQDQISMLLALQKEVFTSIKSYQTMRRKDGEEQIGRDKTAFNENRTILLETLEKIEDNKAKLEKEREVLRMQHDAAEKQWKAELEKKRAELEAEKLALAERARKDEVERVRESARADLQRVRDEFKAAIDLQKQQTEMLLAQQRADLEAQYGYEKDGPPASIREELWMRKLEAEFPKPNGLEQFAQKWVEPVLELIKQQGGLAFSLGKNGKKPLPQPTADEVNSESDDHDLAVFDSEEFDQAIGEEHGS